MEVKGIMGSREERAAEVVSPAYVSLRCPPQAWMWNTWSPDGGIILGTLKTLDEP